MIDKKSLLLFLLMPPASPAHQTAAKALADIPLDSNDKEILGFLRGKPIEKEITTLNKSLLDDLPNLFIIKNTFHPWRRLFQAIEMLGIALPNVIIDNLISILKKESAQTTENPVVLLNYCATLIIAIYGVNGGKLARDQRINTINAIKAFLSNEQNNLQNIPKELHDALKIIKSYLTHPEKNLRIYARNLCQQLSIPLSLNMMLPLATAGFDAIDSKQVDKTVIVIGETGSGKSTLVNSIIGHTTLRWNLGIRDTGMLDVGQADEKLPYAEVGHYGSKTLYVQRIILPGNAKTELVDTIGFHDTRNAEEGICAAVGTPLFLKEKNIDAILIVIPYNTFLPNNEDRGKVFRGLSRTLCGLIKLNELQRKFAQELPIRFVITQLPESHHNEAGFDTSTLKKNILKVAGELLAQAPDEKVLKSKKQELNTAKNELHNLLYKKSILLSFDFDTVLRPRFISDTQKMQYVKQVLDAQEKNWVEKGMFPNIANELKMILRSLLSLEANDRQKKIKEFIAEDETMIDVWQHRTKDLTKEVEELEGQKTILNLLLTQQKLFLFRGHYSAATKQIEADDDLLAIRKYVATPSTQTIPRDCFAFNPYDDNYKNAIEWLRASANQLADLMQRMTTIHNEILDLDAKLKKQEAEFKHDHTHKNEFLEHLNGVFLSDLTIAMQSADNALQKAATRLTTLNTNAKKLNDEIVALEQIELIPVKKQNYMAQPYQLTSVLSQLQSLVTYHTEIFNIKVDHPISYVELSCIRNPSDGTLLFKTPFANKKPADQNSAVLLYPLRMERRDIMRVYAHSDELKKHETGVFTLQAFNLEKGEVTVKYESKYNTHGEAGIRVFADAKRYAPHVTLLNTKKDKAKSLQHEMKQQEEAIDALKKSHNPAHYMQLIVTHPENKDHMRELNALLVRLRYNQEMFAKDTERLPGLKLIIGFIDWQKISSQTQNSHQAIIDELKNKLLIAKHILNLFHDIYVKEIPRLRTVYEICDLFKITFDAAIIELKIIASKAAAAIAAASPIDANATIQNAALARLNAEAGSATHPAVRAFAIKSIVAAADHKTPDKAPGYSALFTTAIVGAAVAGAQMSPSRDNRPTSHGMSATAM